MESATPAAKKSPSAWNRALSRRVTNLACTIRALVGDGLKPEIADNEHAQAVERLREIYQIVAAAVQNGHALFGGIVEADCRDALLSTGLVLHRTAPSSRRAREEMQHTASLVLITLFADAATRGPALIGAAHERVERWLDASWHADLEGEGNANNGSPADCGLASCGNVPTVETLRNLSFAYYVRVGTTTRGGMLAAAAQAQRPPTPTQTAAQLLDHEPTQGIIDAADAELGQQARHCVSVSSFLCMCRIDIFYKYNFPLH